MNSSKGNQSLLKALAVIDAVAEGQRSLKELCACLELPKSTVHRIVQGLIEARYLREVKGIGLVLGTKMIYLGNKAQNDMPLKEIARPFLEELALLTKDTVHLGILDEDYVFYLDKISGERAIQLRSQIGDRLPLALTGLGKALMIDMHEMKRQRIIEAQIQGNQAEMLSRMQKYASCGYSFDLEDNVDQVRCVALPVRNKQNKIIAAISVTSIKAYMQDDRMRELIPVIQSYCQKISDSLN